VWGLIHRFEQLLLGGAACAGRHIEMFDRAIVVLQVKV